MSVVTFSRQYASGGSDIARTVATRLGWTLIDNEFVDRVAEQAGMTREAVELQEERVPTLVERMARALAISSPEVFVASGEAPALLATEEHLVHVTEHVINEAVQHEHVVLVGRGAQAYLGERTATLHVYIVAPREARIRAAMERLHLDRSAAEQTLDRLDDGRRRYVKTHYGRVWDDATNYHMVLNSAHFGYEGCAELIERAVRLGEKGST